MVTEAEALRLSGGQALMLKFSGGPRRALPDIPLMDLQRSLSWRMWQIKIRRKRKWAEYNITRPWVIQVTLIRAELERRRLAREG